jgi:hypothetical protein
LKGLHAEETHEPVSDIETAVVDSLKALDSTRPWVEDRNFRFDTRWVAPEDAEARRRLAEELVALQPDLILSPVTPIGRAAGTNAHHFDHFRDSFCVLQDDRREYEITTAIWPLLMLPPAMRQTPFDYIPAWSSARLRLLLRALLFAPLRAFVVEPMIDAAC